MERDGLGVGEGEVDARGGGQALVPVDRPLVPRLDPHPADGLAVLAPHLTEESQVIATPDLMMGLSGSLEVICKYPDTDKTINHPAPVRLVILPDWIYIITAKCRCQFGQQSEACKCIK